MNAPLDLFKLDGRVALVTGGSGGLGQVFAQALASAGADVALLGRRVDAAQAAADAVREQTGRRTLAVAADVVDPAGVRAAVEHVHAELGRLDILVNSAGVNFRGPSVSYPLDEWYRVVNTSLTGSFVCSQAAAPLMIAAGWGRIINLSSMLGLVGLEERPSYSAAKGGLIQLTRTLAVEWARHNVTVNALAPGPFETEMNRALIENPVTYRAMADKIPLSRWGKLHEMAGVIIFMASEASAYMTGAVLTVDGGYTAQ